MANDRPVSRRPYGQVVGIPSQPNVFYIGVNNGGVWKTTDAGRTWKPIFDDQPTGSIGDVAIAPSNERDLCRLGEGLQRPDLSTGDGMYRSNDGGKTRNIWDCAKPNRSLRSPSIRKTRTAVRRRPPPSLRSNEERGIYRSTDGGTTFERMLYKDVDTGAMQVEFAPNDSNTIYADLWAGRRE
ncbi:MAG: hypothetical protein IPJ30_23285 [Acidobacteria bacterium]|nr:hypothetical protein [Acidobacteriota bacterium]